VFVVVFVVVPADAGLCAMYLQLRIFPATGLQADEEPTSEQME